MNLLTKQKQTQKTNLRLQKAEGVVEGNKLREFGIDIYMPLYLKQITNRTYYITQGTLLNIL